MAKSSSACCSNDNNNIMGMRKGPWTPEEDNKLLAYIEAHGFGNWRTLPEKAGLQRCGKSCRLRWINYLRPDVKRGKFSLQEEQTIIQLHAFLGNRWSAIAAHLPKRTDNEIKNYWNTHIKKRFTKMGIDPTTHKPISDLLSSAAGGGSNTGTLSHMAQWERARLEAEARLVKGSKKLVPNKPSLQMKRSKALAAAPPSRSECLDVLKAWQSVVAGMFGINNTYNNLEPQPPPPTTMFLGNPIDLTAVACSNMGGTGEFMSDDKPNQNLPELNERFDNSMCLHDTTYQNWTASAAGNNNMVEDFWDISVHDFDYPMEEGNSH